MTRRLISSGSRFEELAGYSRAVVDGAWVFVSGCTGYDYASGSISNDVAEQTRQALGNVEAALTQAGAALADVVRVRAYIARREDFETLAPILRNCFRHIRPANTTLICQLVDPKMKVEIEVTALRSGVP